MHFSGREVGVRVERLGFSRLSMPGSDGDVTCTKIAWSRFEIIGRYRVVFRPMSKSTSRWGR